MKVMLHPDLVQQCRYWAAKGGVSVNELIAAAVERWLATRNQDYDLPALEIQRLNQLLDRQTAMDKTLGNLERVVFNGFGSLLTLVGGGDYLLNVEQDVV